MSAVPLATSFVFYSEERVRLHAALSRLWVVHHRLVRDLEQAIGQHDERTAVAALADIGRCETDLVRLELRASQLMCSRKLGACTT